MGRGKLGRKNKNAEQFGRGGGGAQVRLVRSEGLRCYIGHNSYFRVQNHNSAHKTLPLQALSVQCRIRQAHQYNPAVSKKKKNSIILLSPDSMG